MWVKQVLTFLIALSLWVVAAPLSAHNRAFSDPNDSSQAGDLRRVYLAHDGGRVTFKATMWDNFANRTMRPGSGVQWRFDTQEGFPPYDHQVDLTWERHNGRRQYRCRIYDIVREDVEGNFPGRRNEKTVVCPDMPARKWGDRRIDTWDVLSFYNENGHIGLDGSGPHKH
jgi:hypothetical protein